MHPPRKARDRPVAWGLALWTLALTAGCGGGKGAATGAVPDGGLPGTGAVGAQADGSAGFAFDMGIPNTLGPGQGDAALPDGLGGMGGSSIVYRGLGGALGLEGDGGLPAADCAGGTQTVIIGQTYGAFFLQAMRVGAVTPGGVYTMRVTDAVRGEVFVLRDGAFVARYTYDSMETIHAGTSGPLYTLNFAGLLALDIKPSGTANLDLQPLAMSLFDGCHAIAVDPVVHNIRVNDNYNGYRVVSIAVDPAAPDGRYTFVASAGNAGLVQLLRDGVPGASLQYPWQMIVGNNKNHTFTFPGVVALTVTRSQGTANLFGMAQGLFNGRYGLVKP